MEFIHGTTLVHVKSRCWRGEKKASRENDIKLGSDGQMPPEKLLELGRKKIFPSKAIDPLVNKRKAAERVCLAHGTRLIGGYAVADSAIDEVVERLKEIEAQFHAELAKFMVDFDRNKEAWIKENQDYAHLIRDQVPDHETVEKSFEFSFKLIKLQPSKGYEFEDDEIADQVLHEVGLVCKEMSNRFLDRKNAISSDSLLEQLKPLTDKLDTLSFGNGRILSVLDEFRSLESAVPNETIDRDDPFFGITITFLSMCSDSSKLERIVDGTFSVTKLIKDMQAKASFNNSSGSSPQLPLDTQSANSSPVNAPGAYF